MVGDTRGSSDLAEAERKGRAPVGEAWLFEGTVAKSMPRNLR